MSDKGRMDYILLVRNAVEVCQFELKKSKARLEKQNELYISAMIEHITIDTQTILHGENRNFHQRSPFMLYA